MSLRGRAAAAAARAGGVHTAVARCSLRAQHSIPSSRAVTGGPCWCPKVPCMQSLNQVLGASGGRWVAQKPSKCALQCQLPCCPVSSYSTWPGSAVLPVPLCTQPDSCKHAQRLTCTTGHQRLGGSGARSSLQVGRQGFASRGLAGSSRGWAGAGLESTRSATGATEGAQGSCPPCHCRRPA